MSTAVEEMQNKLKEKEMEIERLEGFLVRRRNELEVEACQIQDLELSMGTSHYLNLNELGREVAPEDFLDMENRLENKLKLQQMRTQAVQKEVQESKLLTKQTEELLQNLDAESYRIKAVTGYVEPQLNSRRNKSVCSMLTPQEQKTLLEELIYLVHKIKDEKKMSKEIIAHKEKTISVLAEKEQQAKDQEESVYVVRNQLKTKMRELAKVNGDYEEYRKEHLKADRAIARLENQNDSACLNSLLQDKLFLKAKIYEHVDMRRTQDKAIKAQSFRLQHLQQRADMITAAIADLKMTELVSSKLKGTVQTVEEPICSLDIETILPSDERVDVALYELLSRDVEAINNSIGLKDVILVEKEATIEALEEKVENVLYMNDQDILVKNDENMHLEGAVRALNKEVWNEREVYQVEIANLRKEKQRVQASCVKKMKRTS